MFRGVVPSKIRNWIWENSGFFSGQDVYIGCSGNFTIETVLGQTENPPASVISSDVSLYSDILAAYYLDKPFEIKINKEWQWLNNYADGVEQSAAAVVVLQEMSLYMTQKTRYHRRMWKYIKDNFDMLHARVIEKIQRRKQAVRIDQYHSLDIQKFIEIIPEDGIFLSFMPYFAGDYTKMFKIYDDVFKWEKTEFDELTNERKDELLQNLAKSGKPYVHIDCEERDYMDKVVIDGGGRKTEIFLYSNIQNVSPCVYRSSSVQLWQKPPYPLLSMGTVLKKPYKLVISELKAEHFSWVRDQFLNKSIIPSNPTWGYGVFINDILIGLLGWNRGKDGESYYLLNDTPLQSKVYLRLSKLMCAVAKTKAMGAILRQRTGKFWNSFNTTARTEKPVSMKYRGVFDLLGKNKKDKTLNYGSEFNWTREKALKKWEQWEKKAIQKGS